MYYWDYKGTFLILTDSEEIRLVRELGGEDLSERIGYHIHEDVRRKYERRINQHLKAELLRDPEAFHSRFVFRCWHGTEAQDMFPKFLDAYGRATRLATRGRWRKSDLGEDLVERLVHRDEEASRLLRGGGVGVLGRVGAHVLGPGSLGRGRPRGHDRPLSTAADSLRCACCARRSHPNHQRAASDEPGAKTV